MAARKLSDDEYESFLSEKKFAVILFDAPWDVGPGAEIRPRFEKAVALFGERVNFGEINVDESARVAKSIPIVSIPNVAYFKNGRLIAALVGENQDVAARTQAVLDGAPIGRGDGRWN